MMLLSAEGKWKCKDNSELIEKLVKLDEEAANRAEEQTRKWFELEEQRIKSNEVGATA